MYKIVPFPFISLATSSIHLNKFNADLSRERTKSFHAFLTKEHSRSTLA